MSILLVGGILSIVVVISGFLALIRDPVISFLNSLKTEGIGVCKTKECFAIDENLSSKVDLNQNPCQDFYQYVCGSTPDELSEIYKSQLRIYRQLYDIVKEPVDDKDHRPLKMTKEMFKFCLNHDSSVNDLKNIIKEVGGWPLLNSSWKEVDFSLEKFYSRSLEIGYLPKSLFTITISRDLKNNTRKVIIIKAATISEGLLEKIFSVRWPFESSILDENALIHHFHDNFVPEISQKLNVNQEKAKEEFMEFVRINELVHGIYRYSQKSLTISSFDNRKTLAELQKYYGNIPWGAIFGGVLKSTQIDNNESFVVVCPKCLSFLNKLISNLSKRSLVNYLMWSLLTESLIDADGKVLENWLKSRRKSRVEYCADKTFRLFRRVLDYEYINRHFDKSLRPKVFGFTQTLKNSLEGIIRNSTLMDSETKEYAIAKVNNMVFKIAYDDEIKRKENVEKYFADLNIKPNLYFLSLLNVTKFTIERSLRSVRQSAEIDYLETTSENAAYMLLSNAIFLAASVLGDVFYSKNRPEYLNFGALGFIIGHEMNHGFDVSGHLVGKRGVLYDWWRPETKKNYIKRVECFREQYSKFINVETGNKVDGISTLSENLADNGGVLVAYNAYVKWLKNNGKQELSLPSFKRFTPRQMFWIGFAGVLCSKTSKESVLNHENTDVHATKRIRVNGVVINSADFARDFRCQPNTSMNPVQKCAIWR